MASGQSDFHGTATTLQKYPDRLSRRGRGHQTREPYCQSKREAST